MIAPCAVLLMKPALEQNLSQNGNGPSVPSCSSCTLPQRAGCALSHQTSVLVTAFPQSSKTPNEEPKQRKNVHEFAASSLSSTHSLELQNPTYIERPTSYIRLWELHPTFGIYFVTKLLSRFSNCLYLLHSIVQTP